MPKYHHRLVVNRENIDEYISHEGCKDSMTVNLIIRSNRTIITTHEDDIHNTISMLELLNDYVDNITELTLYELTTGHNLSPLGIYTLFNFIKKCPIKKIHIGSFCIPSDDFIILLKYIYSIDTLETLAVRYLNISDICNLNVHDVDYDSIYRNYRCNIKSLTITDEYNANCNLLYFLSKCLLSEHANKNLVNLYISDNIPLFHSFDSVKYLLIMKLNHFPNNIEFLRTNVDILKEFNNLEVLFLRYFRDNEIDIFNDIVTNIKSKVILSHCGYQFVLGIARLMEHSDCSIQVISNHGIEYAFLPGGGVPSRDFYTKLTSYKNVKRVFIKLVNDDLDPICNSNLESIGFEFFLDGLMRPVSTKIGDIFLRENSLKHLSLMNFVSNGDLDIDALVRGFNSKYCILESLELEFNDDIYDNISLINGISRIKSLKKLSINRLTYRDGIPDNVSMSLFDTLSKSNIEILKLSMFKLSVNDLYNITSIGKLTTLTLDECHYYFDVDDIKSSLVGNSNRIEKLYITGIFYPSEERLYIDTINHVNNSMSLSKDFVEINCLLYNRRKDRMLKNTLNVIDNNETLIEKVLSTDTDRENSIFKDILSGPSEIKNKILEFI